MDALAVAIIKQAVADWSSQDRDLYESGLLAFFVSTWFEFLCDCIGIEPDVIRHILAITNKQDS